MMRRSAKILHRPACRFAKGGSRVERPVGIAQHFAGQEHQVRLPTGDDRVGLRGIGDHAHGGGGDAGFAADARRKRHLEAGADGNGGVGNLATGRNIDQIDAVLRQQAGKLNGFVEGPAAFGPIGGGDADEERQVLRPRGADGIDDLERKAGAIFEAAAVGVGALVGERRQELVKQVAVGGVNLDEVEPGSEGAARSDCKGAR